MSDRCKLGFRKKCSKIFENVFLKNGILEILKIILISGAYRLYFNLVF